MTFQYWVPKWSPSCQFLDEDEEKERMKQRNKEAKKQINKETKDKDRDTTKYKIELTKRKERGRKDEKY